MAWDRIIRLAGPAVAALMALSACGGDDGGSAASSTTATTAASSTTAVTSASTSAPTSTVPASTETTRAQEYIVRKGDNLTDIAKRFNTTVADIVALNNLQNPDRIGEGLRLKIPPPTATTAAPAPTTTAPGAATSAP